MLANCVRLTGLKALGQPFIYRACFSVTAINHKPVQYKSTGMRFKPPSPASRISIPSNREFLSPEYFPATAVLISAKSSGALDLQPKEVIELLKRYISLAQSGKKGWEPKVCSGTNVSAKTLTMVALILRRSAASDGSKKLANHVLYTASKLGDARATVRIVSIALRQGELQNVGVKEPLQQLERLARSGANIEAMLLKAQILEIENKIVEAQKLFKKISEAKPTAENTQAITHALATRGQFLWEKHDKSSAEAVWKEAALGYDDPYCYYLLARHCVPEGSETQEMFLMKAAASGKLDACCHLGKLYLERSKAASGSKNKEKDLMMAKEWSEVIAARD